MSLEVRVFKLSILNWMSSFRPQCLAYIFHNTQRGLHVCGTEVNWSDSNWSLADERHYGMQENASCYNLSENVNNTPKDRSCHHKLSL